MPEGYYIVFDHRETPVPRVDTETVDGLTIRSYVIPVQQKTSFSTDNGGSIMKGIIAISLLLCFAACGPKSIPYSDSTGAPEPSDVAKSHYNWGVEAAEDGDLGASHR